MNVAMQTIWHKAYERALETVTSLRNHCDFKYSKDTKNAKEVKILNAVRPTVKNYVPGTPIEKEYVSATDMTLKLDQFYYFNIALDDIHEAQSVPGAMEATAKEGSLALAEEGDKYVASLVKAGVQAGTIEAIDGGAITKTNVIDKVEDAFAVLYGNNCKVSESYWLYTDVSSVASKFSIVTLALPYLPTIPFLAISTLLVNNSVKDGLNTLNMLGATSNQ